MRAIIPTDNGYLATSMPLSALLTDLPLCKQTVQAGLGSTMNFTTTKVCLYCVLWITGAAELSWASARH